MPVTKQANTNADSGHTALKKGPQNKETVSQVPSSEENANITIRLSELGILKRSPSEEELQIQRGRISHILDKTIEKLKVALCFPYLLRNNCAVLRKYLPNPDVEFVENVCLKYTHPGHMQQLKRSLPFQAATSIVDKISVRDSMKRKIIEKRGYAAVNQDQLIDPHMAQVMEMLWKSHGLKEMILADFENLVDVQSITLVKTVQHLKKIAEQKLSMTAQEQGARDRHLNKAWKANSEIQEKIEEAKQQLEKQRQDLGNQVKIKQAIVEDYQNRIEELTEQFRKDITQKIIDSETLMTEDSNASALRQVDLAIEAKTATQQYESLLTQHLSYEKGLRAKRFKIETQLSSWLAKFDADIGERQDEFEKLTEGYEAEKAEMDALQEKFNEQEEEYVVLMAEKEEEEQRIWEAKAYIYLTNRSARKIQRCWRAYRQRKIDRRKAKIAKAKAKKEKVTSKPAADDDDDDEEGGGQGEQPPAGEGAGKKKKGGGKDKKGKGKGKKKDEPTITRAADPMAALEKKFGDGVLGDLKGEEFPTGEVVVDLSKE